MKKILSMVLALSVIIASVPATTVTAAETESAGSISSQSETANNEMVLTTIAGKTYYYVNVTDLADAASAVFMAGEAEKSLSDLTQIGDTSLYYFSADGDELTGTLYGTTTLSYTEFYAGDTTVESYDAMTSATTTKSKTFPNADNTEVTESGYQILGVKNVPVAVSEAIYAEAQILSEADALPESGVYAEAAGITLNEDADAAVAQYKRLNADGSYSATTQNVEATVTDAAITLKTTSNWGAYELDITENSTSYIRNTRSDEGFAINSNIQGIILEATDGTKVGMRHMEEIWVQPYEVSFNLNTVAAQNLIRKTINKVTYIMPNGTYVYEFADGVFMVPQFGENESFTASFAADGKSVTIDTTNLPSDIENAKVTVYHKEGRDTTYCVQNAQMDKNGTVTLDSAVLANLTYTVIVSSSNYADKAVSTVMMKEVEIAGTAYYVADLSGVNEGASVQLAAGSQIVSKEELTQVGETGIYYILKQGETALTGTLYGTATLSYTDYYANDTSVEEYDAVTSATTSKFNLFTYEDITEVVTEGENKGYQILGVKNVPVAVDAELYVKAMVLDAAEALPESGAYAKAAAITLNENASAAVTQYKTLTEDGYQETKTDEKSVITVNDATLELKTTSVWGAYELDVKETSTKYIRNGRGNTYTDENGNEVEFKIGSNIQGLIIGATDAKGESISVGMRYTEEIWVQPYEVAFNLGTTAAEKLIGTTVNKITFITPTESYVYNFADGVYVVPQFGENEGFTASFAADGKSVTVDTTKLPSDIKDTKVTVYYKEGRNTTYYVQNAQMDKNGTVTLDSTALPNLTYTVIVSSSNYADKAVSVAAPVRDIADCSITLAADSYTYDGTAKTPEVTVEGLTLGTDYTVSYAGNVNAGTAAVTVTGTGNYTGTKSLTFKIEPKNISAIAASITVANCTYTGKEQQPAVTVKGLTKGKDYTVAYSNNVNAGTGKAAITGKGNYTGTTTVNFTIAKKAATITASNKTTAVGAKAFRLGAKVNSGGKLSYTTSSKKIVTVNNSGKVTVKGVGKATITITAKATTNYKAATKKITVTVNPKAVSNVKAVSSAKKTVKVSWKKVSSVTGYQIQCATNKNFKKATTKTVKGASKTSQKLTKLTSGKKYYVRVRTYKTVSGKQYYSSWSSAKTVKVK